MDLRIKNIYARLEKAELDGLIVSLPSNTSYLTRFASRDAYLVISKSQNFYITDSRYTEEAKENLGRDFTIKKIDGSHFFKVIADACGRLRLKRVGFEERYMPFAEYKKIREALSKTTDLIPTHSLIEELRQIKSTEELEKIKKAVQITITAFEFIKDYICPGKREIEISAELERFIRYNGARACSFDIIVASGPNSSYPHHVTSQRKIKDNEPVLIDMGVDYLGYKSDLTRVFFLGKISPVVKRIYNIVSKAKARAIREIKPNVFINEIDRTARQYIAQKGFGGFFCHNLGHGIGLEVHEAPHISSKEKDHKLKAGMVFTVEPAIYLPHRFGIRLEDMVLVTKEGCKIL